MKVEIIIGIFDQKDQVSKPIIFKALNTIKDWKRKTELRLSFREIKTIYDQYSEDREILIKRLIKEFCDEENEKNKNEDSFKKLKADEINRIPPSKISEFNKEIKKMNDADIEIKAPLKFYDDEINHANLLFEEEELLYEFINWGVNKPSPKKEKPKKK